MPVDPKLLQQALKTASFGEDVGYVGKKLGPVLLPAAAGAGIGAIPGAALGAAYNGLFGKPEHFYDDIGRGTLRGALTGGGAGLGIGVGSELDGSEGVGPRLGGRIGGLTGHLLGKYLIARKEDEDEGVINKIRKTKSRKKEAKVYEAGEAVEGMKPKEVYESHKKCTPGEFGMNKEGDDIFASDRALVNRSKTQPLSEGSPFYRALTPERSHLADEIADQNAENKRLARAHSAVAATAPTVLGAAGNMIGGRPGALTGQMLGNVVGAGLPIAARMENAKYDREALRSAMAQDARQRPVPNLKGPERWPTDKLILRNWYDNPSDIPPRQLPQAAPQTLPPKPMPTRGAGIGALNKKSSALEFGMNKTGAEGLPYPVGNRVRNDKVTQPAWPTNSRPVNPDREWELHESAQHDSWVPAKQPLSWERTLPKSDATARNWQSSPTGRQALAAQQPKLVPMAQNRSALAAAQPKLIPVSPAPAASSPRLVPVSQTAPPPKNSETPPAQPYRNRGVLTLENALPGKTLKPFRDRVDRFTDGAVSDSPGGSMWDDLAKFFGKRSSDSKTVEQRIPADKALQAALAISLPIVGAAGGVGIGGLSGGLLGSLYGAYSPGEYADKDENGNVRLQRRSRLMGALRGGGAGVLTGAGIGGLGGGTLGAYTARKRIADLAKEEKQSHYRNQIMNRNQIMTKQSAFEFGALVKQALGPVGYGAAGGGLVGAGLGGLLGATAPGTEVDEDGKVRRKSRLGAALAGAAGGGLLGAGGGAALGHYSPDSVNAINGFLQSLMGGRHKDEPHRTTPNEVVTAQTMDPKTLETANPRPVPPTMQPGKLPEQVEPSARMPLGPNDFYPLQLRQPTGGIPANSTMNAPQLGYGQLLGN